MSLLRNAFSKRALGDSNSELIPQRPLYFNGAVNVTPDTALTHSAVWAALRLRADLISTTPVDVYRRVAGVQIDSPKPPLLTDPSGNGMSLADFLYATQMDLDRYGNCFGIITQRDAYGLPARIELLSAGDVSATGVGMTVSKIRYRNNEYDIKDVWHERSSTVAGYPLGISPLTQAALSISSSLSAQKFTIDRFAAGPTPKGVLKNTKVDVIDPNTADEAARRFKAATRNGDLFVAGSMWEYTPASMESVGAAFLEEMKFGVVEIARFLGVPADMIDGGVSGSTVTYANVTQRNLQFLIMNLGPVFTRRENALTAALPNPRYVKFNTDALLRMDPASRVDLLAKQVSSRLMTPSEAREIEDRQPFSEDQFAEFDRLFGKPGVRVTDSIQGGTHVPPLT